MIAIFFTTFFYLAFANMLVKSWLIAHGQYKEAFVERSKVVFANTIREKVMTFSVGINDVKPS
jgi:hypothetical protein